MDKKKLKVVARQSNLALAQVNEFFSYYPEIVYDLIKVKSIGDKNKDISLMSKVPADLFTRELDQFILSGKGDVAIHSAKDLPYPLTSGLNVITLTRAFDKRDALVSRKNLNLKELPAGSRIGSSSRNREEQVIKARPDLTIIPIRGSIEERLSQITSGKIDALIVAICALKRLGLEEKISDFLPFKTHPLQGHLAVITKLDRADLKVIFSPSDIRLNYGKVFLLGLDNGEPGLLTFKANEILEHTDIIFYDDLIDKNILEDYSAKKVFVGKRKGKHSISQNEINEMLYKAAIKGVNVTRLKGGDPFIFGRGGEELHFLQERMISVEVVPGINSASLSASSSGIPLTMRGVSNKVSFISGHNLGNSGKTQVFFMGASKLKEIKNKIINEGNKLDTPVALIQDAGKIYEKLTITDIKNMNNVNAKSPLIIIIGDVVKQYQSIPNILFTGLNPYSCKVQGKIIHYPLIDVEIISVNLKNLSKYSAIMFTSRTAVKAFCKSNEILKKQKVISIGPYTKKELQYYGYKVDYMPRNADSNELFSLIKRLRFKKILYPCSNISENMLHKLGNVRSIVLYKTKLKVLKKIDLNRFSGIVFSSSSTVDAFFTIYNNIPRHIVIYVYGKHSAKKLKDKGYDKTVQTLQISKNS